MRKNPNLQDPGPQGPGQFRMILRYKPQASSAKQQAPAGLNDDTIKK